jgi:hypothetical protein
MSLTNNPSRIAVDLSRTSFTGDMSDDPSRKISKQLLFIWFASFKIILFCSIVVQRAFEDQDVAVSGKIISNCPNKNN